MDFSKPKILIDLNEYNHLKESYKTLDEDALFDLRFKHTIAVLEGYKSELDTKINIINKEAIRNGNISSDAMDKIKIVIDDISCITRIIEGLKKNLDEK